MGSVNPIELGIFIAYLVVLIFIGLKFYNASSDSSEGFLLGGRGLGSWVTAFSAQASDMSGWLLMAVCLNYGLESVFSLGRASTGRWSQKDFAFIPKRSMPSHCRRFLKKDTKIRQVL